MSKVEKVPVIMQMEALECGAASLCMVLAYHGKWLPLDQVRSDCGVSRDGSNAKSIVQAARSYGLVAKGKRCETEILRELPLPAIIHWNFNHFVVLDGFNKDKAIINDPAKGRVVLPYSELEAAFTGIALCFEKGDTFTPEGKPKSVMKFAAKRLKGTAHAIIFIMLISFLASAVGLVPPLASRFFMDYILAGTNPELLIPFTLVMGGAILFQFLVLAVQSISMMRMNGRFAITANTEFIWHVLHLPIEFFSQRYAGDIAARQASNENITRAIMEKVAPILINTAFLVLYLVFMLQLSIPLTLTGILAAAINIASVSLSSKTVLGSSRVAQISANKLAGITVSGIEMIETIKASGAESSFFERWAGYFALKSNAEVSMQKTESFLDEIPIFIQQLANIAVLMTGVYLIMAGSVTIGMLLAFQGFLTGFLSPVSDLSTISRTLTNIRVDMECVEDVMNYKREMTVSRPEEGSGKLDGSLEIRDITFGYAKLAEPLIRNFSVSLKPGSTVAFVGGSGCGKSTLAKLITGLYQPWEGEILFNGKKKEEIDSYKFKGSVAMIDQEITIFEDSVSDNIRMWDASIEDFAVIMAARDADIHRSIASRPGGYDYMVSEGGRDFSGGERQRLEIARVLAAEPTIIILDEATSALDAKTEEMVIRNIKNLGATCIIIAHRLSTIRDCDEIIVLDKGAVVERGTHDRLMENNGKYAALVTVE